MQRARAGEANFKNAGRDRRFDILAATSPWIPLPFAPFRDHCHFPKTVKAAITALQIIQPGNAVCAAI